MKHSVNIDRVYRSFGKKEVLKDISLIIEPAQIFGLLGPSGAGKTTLIKLIAGIDSANKGRVSVMDKKMPNLNVMSHIGFMAQSNALYNELNAKENLEFFASIYGLHGKKRNQRINEVMELVELKSDLKRIVSTYSGGMKRRLSLAASLLHKPELLILDEPTVGIDPVLRKAIWDELEKLSRHGTTIIVTTHVMDEAEKCHQLGMLRDGRVIAVGTPESLKEQTLSKTIEEAFLYYGGARL